MNTDTTDLKREKLNHLSPLLTWIEIRRKMKICVIRVHPW